MKQRYYLCGLWYFASRSPVILLLLDHGRSIAKKFKKKAYANNLLRHQFKYRIDRARVQLTDRYVNRPSRDDDENASAHR